LIFYFSQKRISAAANLVIAVMLTFLFVAPISLLYLLSSNTSGLRRAVASIGVLMSFTLVFTALTSAFTRAKRHEVTAASAAYVPLSDAILTDSVTGC
jgi:cbb3-type cytochrome oxidase subunit 3